MLVAIFIVLLLSGLPIYVTMALTTLIFMIDSGVDPVLVAKSLYAGADQYPLIAVVGFMLVGNLFEKAGITQEIIDLVRKFMGRNKAGLAVITIVSCAVFAAVSGSGPATVATIGGLMIPAMIRAGYPASFAAAISAGGGALGVLIPPSNPFLMYGVIARESIAALFAAGVIPGIIMTIALSITSKFLVRFHPELKGEVSASDGILSDLEVPSKKNPAFIFRAIYDAKWALTSIVMLLGGIYTGMFTPIEAAEVTAFYTIAVGLFVTRTMKVADIWRALVNTMRMSGTMLILVAAATAFGRLITMYQVPQALGGALASMTSDPYITMLLICAVLIFVGFWGETFSMIVVLTPIFLPVILNLGISPIQFGVIFVVCAEIGFLTPPFGCNLFIGMKLANVSLESISVSALPYVATYMMVLVLLIFFPILSTFLPNLLFGG